MQPTQRTRRRRGRKIPFDINLKYDLIDCLKLSGYSQSAFADLMRPDEEGRKFGANLVSKIINGAYDGKNIGTMTESEIRHTIDQINAETSKQKPTLNKPIGTKPVVVHHMNGNGNGQTATIEPPKLTFPDHPVIPRHITAVNTEPTAEELQERALDILLRLTPAQLKKAVSFLGVVEKADV